jgi:hypothetical protein
VGSSKTNSDAASFIAFSYFVKGRLNLSPYIFACSLSFSSFCEGGETYHMVTQITL